MEYLPGGSLRALLKQRGRLPVDDAVRIAADVCDGLAAAHARGIVHRDIKPENILPTADGRAKVGDFGIAHVPSTAGGAYMGGLTQTGFQPGTLIYMSPEQIRGEVVGGPRWTGLSRQGGGPSDILRLAMLQERWIAGKDCELLGQGKIRIRRGMLHLLNVHCVAHHEHAGQPVPRILGDLSNLPKAYYLNTFSLIC